MEERHIVSEIMFAIRYGEWRGGRIDRSYDANPPYLALSKVYYDGHWIVAYFGPVWVSVYY